MAEPSGSRGPLGGVRVVELAGIGPGPFSVMLLADLGAEVIRVDRLAGPGADYTPNPVIERGRRSIALDLKRPDHVAVALDLVATADVLIESFRPGVTERLGLGPGECLAVNPRLVYGRLTGWGQDGPLATTVGHDINYIGMTGALHAIGRAGGPPVPPLNLVGDFGGGAMSMAFGIVCALLEVRTTGRGQVVDANVFDSTISLLGLVHGLRAVGRWTIERGTNLLDTGCPYYDVYECSDGRWMAVGTIEERFFRVALDVLGLSEHAAAHGDRAAWPALRKALREVFCTRTRDEWTTLFGDRECCVTPVLDLDEASQHPHTVARRSVVPLGDSATYVQPNVAPRFSASAASVPAAPSRPGEHTAEILAELGYGAEQVERLTTDLSG